MFFTATSFVQSDKEQEGALLPLLRRAGVARLSTGLTAYTGAVTFTHAVFTAGYILFISYNLQLFKSSNPEASYNWYPALHWFNGILIVVDIFGGDVALAIDLRDDSS